MATIRLGSEIRSPFMVGISGLGLARKSKFNIQTNNNVFKITYLPDMKD